VGTHIQNLLGKLDVHSRAQAVALAHRVGLVALTLDVVA
jgi:DNA-binding CsgD family transcriptional regulator